MNALILAAGYATRLYPLTLNRAKPLLPVAGKPIIQWVVEQLEPIAGLERICIVTNNRFERDFVDWTASYRASQPVKFEVMNDGSNSDSDKLGAIGDIYFAANKADLFSSDLLVVAGGETVCACRSPLSVVSCVVTPTPHAVTIRHPAHTQICNA